MTYYQDPEPNKLISNIARDLILMARDAEGMDRWQERHHHVRLFAEDLYGDSEEASLLGAMMSLQLHRI